MDGEYTGQGQEGGRQNAARNPGKILRPDAGIARPWPESARHGFEDEQNRSYQCDQRDHDGELAGDHRNAAHQFQKAIGTAGQQPRKSGKDFLLYGPLHGFRQFFR